MTPYLTSSAKFNSKQTTDLNGKEKTIKFPKVNKGKYRHTLEVGKELLNRTQDTKKEKTQLNLGAIDFCS